MAAGIYVLNTTQLEVDNGTTNTIMSNADQYWNGDLAGTFTAREIFRRGNSLCLAYNGTTARQFPGYSLGATSEPTGSIWLNSNNQKLRLYMANASNRYSFIPFITDTYEISGVFDDPNIFGYSTANLNFHPGSGTNSSTGNSITRYLGLSANTGMIVFRVHTTRSSFAAGSGTAEYGFTGYSHDSTGNVTKTAALKSYSTIIPTVGTTSTYNRNPASNDPFRVPSGAQSRFRISVQTNNHSHNTSFTIVYAIVPDAYFASTGTRLVY